MVSSLQDKLEEPHRVLLGPHPTRSPNISILYEQ